MTQEEFNDLPLLLRRAEVCQILDWSPARVHEWREDGVLRIFLPNPQDAYAYYYRADVARIHGHLVMDTQFIGHLPMWIRSGLFRRFSGLAEHAFYAALEHGQLVGLRRNGRRQEFYSKDLEWFV